MKKIIATDGSEFLVDVEDYEFLDRHLWTTDSGGYAVSSMAGRTVPMHRLVFGRVPTGMVVDHTNRNQSDNRKSNLRLATSVQNAFNTGKMPFGRTSKYVGVQWNKQKNKWRSSCSVNGKEVYICYGDDEDECARMRDAFVYAVRGKFAFLNFPDEISTFEKIEFPERLKKYL